MKRKTNQRGFAIAQVLVAIGLMGALGGVSYMYNQNQLISYERNLLINGTNTLDLAKATLINDIRSGLTVSGVKSTLSDMGVNTPVGNDGQDSVITPLAGFTVYNPAKDGFNIPPQSGAPKVDPWGSDLLYCPFNNGNGLAGSDGSSAPSYSSAPLGTVIQNADPYIYIVGDATQQIDSIVFAIISAGLDRTFQTTCKDIKEGIKCSLSTESSGSEGEYKKCDDGIRVVTVSDVKDGVGGTRFYGDPINVAADLANVVAEHNELRMVSSTGVVYKYDATIPSASATIGSAVSSSGGWMAITSPKMQTFTDGGNCAEFGQGATTTTDKGELLVCIPSLVEGHSFY